MKLLFEDNAEDRLSKLFRYALPKNVLSQIEYACGNGNLVSRAETLLCAGEYVLVILDTIPANKSIRDVYLSLRRLSRQHDYRLIVWNVICAEYYFIKCFGKDRQLRPFIREDDFETVLKVKPYKTSSLIQTDEDRAFTKTFEKFCKLYLMKNGGECITTNPIFFTENCQCGEKCTDVTLFDKSIQYRSVYEIDFIHLTDVNALWDIHRKLLNFANQTIETYNQAGYLNIKAYPLIR